MSSAPSGLDAREYVYDAFPYLVPDGAAHVVAAQNLWQVTRVQLYAASGAAAQLRLSIGGLAPFRIFDVAAGGCLTLEPNGAFRNDFTVSGLGALLIIEFWFQASLALPLGKATVTVTP